MSRPIKYDYNNTGTTITCPVCSTEKLIKFFYKGIYSKCKSCHSKHVMALRNRPDQKKKFREYQYNYFLKNYSKAELVAQRKKKRSELERKIVKHFKKIYDHNKLFKYEVYKQLAEIYNVSVNVVCIIVESFYHVDKNKRDKNILKDYLKIRPKYRFKYEALNHLSKKFKLQNDRINKIINLKQRDKATN